MLKLPELVCHEYDPRAERNGPASHAGIYSAVRKQGQARYSDYIAQPSTAQTGPWKLDLQKRVMELSAFARRCLESVQNEAEWRFKLEHRVLGQFDCGVYWYGSFPSSGAH